ncbi:Hypothetical protein P9303_04851 [Prochlorococcus marinus str. MIT 9303]|uniref:Uncharacterized protein n=1 Tax=Prochlorococcus marinus (strain MIT 9303) TaxID=59922 RepID=A2C6X7_PROM3|nr:Hypothetical protein P9303_04851 [Prochlorococcus marinus str. MIT 9303]
MLRAINLNGVIKATPKAVAVIQIKMHHADQASQEKGSTLRPPLKSLSKKHRQDHRSPVLHRKKSNHQKAGLKRPAN